MLRITFRGLLLSSLLAALLAVFAGSVSLAQQIGVQPAAGESIPLPAEAQNAEQIFEFLDGLGEMEPAGKSEEEVVEHQKKIFRTVNNAIDKALALEITDAQAMEGHFYKLQALQYLQRLGEPGANEQFNAAINAALSDRRPQVNDIGMKFHVETGLGMWPQLNDQQKAGLIQTIAGFVSRGAPDENKLQMVMTVVDYLGDMPSGASYSKQLLDATIPLYKNSGKAELMELVPLLEGIARRMALPGNPIELRGKSLDGTEFNWAAYRGKVVLVDFWASWCGPCLAEIPHVVKMYKAYHGKGFDVVGINIDAKIEDAQAKVKQLNVPWVTIYDHGEELANYYGITGIPRAILVDQTGNVVSMMARGKNLEVELRKLLGEPLAAADELNVDDSVQPASAEVEEEPASAEVEAAE
jgi:thiol-disulfide isomerase/thioredoxin